MSLEAVGKVAGWKMPYRLQGLAFRLADHHNGETGKCCPSLERLAEWGKCTVRGVQKGLAELEGLGVIKREDRYIEGRQTTSQYHFCSPQGEHTFTPEGEQNDTPEGEPQFTQNQEVGTRKKEPLYKGLRMTGYVNEDAEKEFIDHRINLKAKLTQSALERAMRGAVASSKDLGITPEQAIQETIDAGWKGIRSDWLKKRLSNEADKQVHGKRSQADINKFHYEYYRKAYAEAVAEEMGGRNIREDEGEVWS